MLSNFKFNLKTCELLCDSNDSFVLKCRLKVYLSNCFYSIRM